MPVRAVSTRTRLLILIACAALLPRAALLVVGLQHPERLCLGDSATYLRPAVNLLDGHGLSQRDAPPFTPDVRRTPVYPLFVAALYGAFGRHLTVIAAAQVVLSVLTVVGTHLLGRRLLPPAEARLGGLLCAASLGSIVYSVLVLTETLFTFLMLGATLLLATYLIEGRSRALIGSGILGGTALICRPIALCLPLIQVSLVALAGRGGRRGVMRAVLLLVFAVLIVVTPWLLRNYVMTGTATLSTIGSHNLLFYNAASLEAAARGCSRRELEPELSQRVEAERVRRRMVETEATLARLQGEIAVGMISAQPWRYACLHFRQNLNSLLPNVTELLELLGVTHGAKGTLGILNRHGLRAATQHYFGDRVWVVWILLPLLGVLGLTYLGTMIGVVALARRRDWFVLALLLLPILSVLLMPGAAAHPRFRVPVMPHICLLAGTGLEVMWRQARRTWAARGCRSRKV